MNNYLTHYLYIFLYLCALSCFLNDIAKLAYLISQLVSLSKVLCLSCSLTLLNKHLDLLRDILFTVSTELLCSFYQTK